MYTLYLRISNIAKRILWRARLILPVGRASFIVSHVYTLLVAYATAQVNMLVLSSWTLISLKGLVIVRIQAGVNMPKSMHCAGNIATLLFFKRKKHLIMISSPRLLHHRLIRKIHRRSNNEDRAKVMHPSVKPAGTARVQSTLNHYYIESSSSSSHSPLIAILRPNDRERSTHPKCFMAF